MIIAIDGYSSCGKSSFAKLIARELDYLYIDSGAMYRAFTLYCLQKGVAIDSDPDINKISELLPEVSLDFKSLEGFVEKRIYLNGQDVEQQIRSMDVSNAVSPVSKIPAVRMKMVYLQRKLSEGRGVVMDGRDIGTVVFPNAKIKIFMTADPLIRAKRRHKELLEKGVEISLEEVEKNIRERDYIDENRAQSPLRKAEDAHLLDNSYMSIDEQMKWFQQWLKVK
jgi:cytidylate kinase